MTVHCCRDLVLGGYEGFSSGSYDSMWALSVFMQGVLNYTYESSAGNLVPPSYSAATVSYSASSSLVSMYQPSCLITVATGTILGGSGSLPVSGSAALVFSKDAINLSTLTSIACPGGSTSTPIGLWVAIRSTSYPLANSGIFLVVSESKSANTLFIDYRSTSSPPLENTAYVTASFWLPPPGSDNTNPARTGASWSSFAAFAGNGNTGQYQTNGTATFPRVLLQSPDPSGYQVRLCMESSADCSGFVSTGFLTAIPGFSGTVGDFPTQNWASPYSAPHLHALQWFNKPSNYDVSYYPVGGSLIGFDITQTTSKGSSLGYPDDAYAQNKRFYAWGSDQTGTCAVFERGYAFSYAYQATTNDSFIIFGLPYDETVPLPADNVNRLFVVGNNKNNANRIDWSCGTYSTDGNAGLAFSLDKKQGPIVCVMSSYAYAAYQTSAFGGADGGLIFDSNAADTPFLDATELISVDLIAGAYANLYNFPDGTGYQGFSVEPRRLGRVPFARQGRATGQTNWSTADTPMQWFYISNGVYLPWGGITGL